MPAIAGVNTMVTLGLTRIVGIGTWRFDGITTDMIEVSELCGEWKTFLCGLKDGGSVSFDGYYDMTIDHHHALIDYNLRCVCLTSLRFYLSCNTDGSYWKPTKTGVAGSGMTNSCIRIESFEISADKGGLASISFTGKIEGSMTFH